MCINIPKSVIIILIVVSFVAVFAITMVTLSASESYLEQRNELLNEEKSTFFGHDVTLTTKELRVNKILRREKIDELTIGYKNSSDFLPSLRFFQAKERIDKSRLFDFIRRIPKGASLHTHLLAAASVDFLIKNISYRDNLYGGYVNGVFKLKFLSGPGEDQRTNWTLIKEKRTVEGAEHFDQWLRKQLSLNFDEPEDKYRNVETVWKKFKNIFTTTYDMFSYKPVFQDYIEQLLHELYDDNVMYTELKGTIMPLYELDGTTYNKQEFFEIFIETVNEFKSKNPGFWGVRYIHSVYRGVDEETLRTSLHEIIQLKRKFPDFIAGFDFVGFEEEGKTLLDYSPQLLEAQNDIRFFFHAGETPWFGHTDINLADAILLNSSRIGHGFALTKHPKLLDLAKRRNIPLEICPISNQELMLNQDPRNHPAATLMALNYPLVVCNDDPSLWNATGLSYDWYVVFMAMTPKTGGLEILKKLAINSIVYSTMEETERKLALSDWEKQWERFLNVILQLHD